MDQYKGTVETTFGPAGLICKLSAILPEGISIIGEDSPYNDTEIKSSAE
jgi:hypothetical protein